MNLASQIKAAVAKVGLLRLGVAASSKFAWFL